jgi:hypothetical protein
MIKRHIPEEKRDSLGRVWRTVGLKVGLIGILV